MLEDGWSGQSQIYVGRGPGFTDFPHPKFKAKIHGGKKLRVKSQ